MSALGKRKADETVRPNKRTRQREQRVKAHVIAVQPSSEATGSRSSVPTSAPAIRLPAQLLADRELAKYAFETKSLLKAIRTSSTGSSVRAWQLLPRHKRRRGASHNLLALPKRLRAKGRSELRASNTAPRTRADVRRRKGKGERAALGAYPRRKEGKRRSALVVRATEAAARGRAWLETHLWHAKRFRMSARQAKVVAGEALPMPDRWGFSLAEESSAKSHRSSWRDDKKAVTLLDRSYDSWFRISATVRSTADVADAASALSTVLRQSGLQSGWQEEWQDGKTLCDTLLVAAVSTSTSSKSASVQVVGNDDGGAGAWRARAPVQMIWVGHTSQSSDSTSVEPPQRKRREVLLRTHPACAAQIERSLRQAVSPALRGSGMHARLDVLRLNSVPHPIFSAGSGAVGRKHASAKKRSGTEKGRASSALVDRVHSALRTEWMRQQAFNVFELGGPMAGVLLAKVLLPVHGESESTYKDKLQANKAKDGEVFSLHVHDPRLSFPPRARRSTRKGHNKATTVSAATLLSGGAQLPSYSSGEIQSRRATLPTPGARLLPTSKDDRVPVVLLRKASSLTSSWTLLVPRGWGKAFWLSLAHSDTRVLGQVQHHALRFDKGQATFPYDWVGTPAYERAEEDASQRAYQKWQRTPPAKRCNFDSTGARWPFGGYGMWVDVVRNGAANALQAAAPAPSRPPWLFALSSEDDSRQLHALVDVLAVWDREQPMPTELEAVQSAVVCVRITACRKGAFARWDEVHRIPTSSERRAWRASLKAVQADKHQRSVLQRLEQRTRFDAARQIGAVTTAQFSLSDGKGRALASISLLAYLDIVLHERRESASAALVATETMPRPRNPIATHNIVLLRSVTGGPFRAASIEPLLLLL